MLLKFILPLFLLGVVYFVGRVHASRRRLPPPSVHEVRPFLAFHQGPAGKIAIVLVISAVLSATWMIVSHWRETHQVVEIRVLDISTGKKTVYEARQGDVHGRMFTTLDGRSITLADVERMELIPR
ncbi:MAG: hypothetical protein H7829_15330 [Magnetococcus sp. THC-1_WYH]